MKTSTLSKTLLTAATVASAIAYAQTVRAIDDNDGFILPSKNIACISHDLTDAAGNSSPILRCEILSKLNPMPPQPESCQFDWGNGLRLTKENTKATVLCVGDTMYSPNYPTLDYGQTWKRNGFTCKSTTNGLTCTNGKGNGLFLNREEWKTF